MLDKLYSTPPCEGRTTGYSPAECCGTRKIKVKGDPDIAQVSTSFVERQDLTMRMSMRRMTRLTNAFSKKIENQAHAVAIRFMPYNVCRIHQTRRVRPGMQAGPADHARSLEDMAACI